MTSVQALPQEVLLNICQYLERIDLVNFGKTCYQANVVVQTNKLWDSAYLECPPDTLRDILSIVSFRRQPWLLVVETEGLRKTDWALIDEILDVCGSNVTLSLL